MNLANSVETTDTRIQNLINSGEIDSATRLIEDRISKDDSDPDAHYLLGVCRYLKGNLGECIESLKKSLSLNPHHTDAAICLSVVYNDVGRYDEAKKIFGQANKSISSGTAGQDRGIDAKFAVKHLELADLYFRYRRYDEAIEEYGKAALLDPHTLDIRIRRAKAFAKKGYISRAVQELQSLKSENSSYLPGRIQLGLLHYSQGNVLDAELEWEEVLNFDPENREASSYLEMARNSRLSSGTDTSPAHP